MRFAQKNRYRGRICFEFRVSCFISCEAEKPYRFNVLLLN
jgi:hypothetical protein